MSKQEAIRNAIIEKVKRVTFEGIAEASRFRQKPVRRPRYNSLIRTGDMVQYTNKDALFGQKGKVLSIDRKLHEALVENVNTVPELQTMKQEDGKAKDVVSDRSRPVLLKYLSLVDPVDGKPTKAFMDADNQRMSKRTNKPIPLKSWHQKQLHASEFFDTSIAEALAQTWCIEEMDVFAPPFPRDLKL